MKINATITKTGDRFGNDGPVYAVLVRERKVKRVLSGSGIVYDGDGTVILCASISGVTKAMGWS